VALGLADPEGGVVVFTGAVPAAGVRRFMARLATLDLDPPTMEFLTAVLTADTDLREGLS
jgi:hypothetical protein